MVPPIDCTNPAGVVFRPPPGGETFPDASAAPGVLDFPDLLANGEELTGFGPALEVEREARPGMGCVYGRPGRQSGGLATSGSSGRDNVGNAERFQEGQQSVLEKSRIGPHGVSSSTRRQQRARIG